MWTARKVHVTEACITEPAMIVTDGGTDVLVVRRGLLPEAVMRWLGGEPIPGAVAAIIDTAAMITALALAIAYVST